MALFDDLSQTWKWINNSVDILFFCDIFIIFNTAIYDDDFLTITDRTAIAKEYLTGWFLLDLFCIIPFEYMMGNGGTSTGVVRLARIGRINKILKLMKLIRLTKIARDKKKSG